MAANSQLRKLRQAEEQTVLTGGDIVVAHLSSTGMLCTLYLQLWLACYGFNCSAACHSTQSAAAECC